MLRIAVACAWMALSVIGESMCRLTAGWIRVGQEARRVPTLLGGSALGWMRGAARRTRHAILLCFLPLVAPAVAPLVLFSWGLLASPWIWPEYDYLIERYSGVAVLDSEGRFLGVVPGPLEPWGDFKSPDHKAIYVDRVPEPWLGCLEYLEDRHRDHWWRSRFGVDAIGLVRAAGGTFTGRIQGASTMPMQLVRSLRHRAPDPGEPLGGRLGRKITELLHAPVVVSRMAGAHGRRNLDRALAMHLPLAIGAPGSRLGDTLYGLGTVSWSLFGVSPEALKPAQQALLAAAVHRPIILAPADDPRGLALAEARWAAIKRRAVRCAPLLAADEKSAEELRREIAGAERPRPAIEAALYAVLPQDPGAQLAVLGNPSRRALFFVSGELTQALAELREQVGPSWRGRVTAIRLTVDAREAVLVRRAVERGLATIERDRAEALLTALTPAASEPRAQVLLALADGVGRMVALYSSHERPLYGDPDDLRDPLPGPRNIRQIGSLGKVILAVYLGQTDRPSDRYCNARTAGVRNAGGGRGVADCRKPGALYTAGEVFGRSLNLPLLSRLRAPDEAPLAALVKDAGFRIPPGAQPSAALTLGIATASPRQIHRLMGAVLAGVVGEEPRAALPHVVASVDLVDGDEVRSRQPDAWAGSLADSLSLYFPVGREYVRRVLSAPLGPGGTLGRLGHWRGGVHPGIDLHIAKSGTTLTPTPSLTRDAYAAGGFVSRGRRYTYIALIGSPNHRVPLGRGFHGGDVAPLVASALSTLIER